jgi:hypothetical protein
MSEPRRDDQIEQPGVSPEIAALRATVAALTLDNEALRTRLGERYASPEWRALKSCDLGPYSYECIRLWCVRRLIIAEKRGGRWFVDEASLNARLAMLAAFDR